METLFLLLFWFIFTLAAGYSILKILFRKNWPFAFGEALALSYGAGIAAISLGMALMSLFGIKFGIPSILACFLPLILVAILIPPRRWGSHLRGGSVGATKENKIFSGLEKFFIAVIALEVIYVFFRTLIMPMESYDAIAIYALKSKIFYLNGMIPPDFFKSFANLVPHIEYPLLMPLAQTQFYVFLGSLNDLLVKSMFPLYYVSLLTIFYFVSKRFLNRKAALFFTFLLATIPQVTDFATNGYADIPFAFYSCVSFFYLCLWLKQRQNPILVLSFIFSIFAMWTKAEGLVYALINAAVITACMVKERRIRLIGVGYAVMSVCAVITYILAWRVIGLEVNTDFASTQVPLFSKIMIGFKRIPAILYEYQIQFFGPKRWNIIWILFISGFILGFKRIFSKDMFPVTLGILLIFSSYSVVYMLSSAPQGFGWHLSTSGSRLFIHFVPIVVLWLALLFKEFKLEI